MSFALRSYQVAPADRLESLLRDKVGTAVDLSDMGTGKTFVACDVLRRLDLPTLVVCPYVSQADWRSVGATVGTDFDVINWEMLRTGRTPYGTFQAVGRGSRFVWAKEVKAVVFDEVHMAGGLKSLNSKMVVGAKAQGKKVLGLTATPAESPLQLKAIGFLTGLHRGVDFWHWALSNGCFKAPFGGLKFTEVESRAQEIMRRLNAQIDLRSVRVRIADHPDQFPEVIYTSPLIEIDEAEEVDRLHAEAAAAYQEIQSKGLRGGAEDHPMTKLLRARQRIEILKLPGFIELGQKALSAGHTVLFFVNFKQTIAALKVKFPEFGVIDGDSKNRNDTIAAVQADRMRGLILNNEAGCAALSAHDITGKHPRYSIMSPSIKPKSHRQATGRTRRNGSITTPQICVPCVAGTCEERLKKRREARLDNCDILCDGELYDKN